MKRIALITDLSCFGKCSTTTMLPVLSAAGFEVCPLPVMLLSSHTAYPGPATENTLHFAQKTAQHWAALHLHFDAILISYLGSEQSIQFAASFVQQFRTPDTLLILDPVMGDGGRLYSGLPADYPSLLAPLCRSADCITPNRTEAAFLLGSAANSASAADSDILAALMSLGPRFAVLTGARDVLHNQIGAIWRDVGGSDDGVMRPVVSGSYHGTGDLFAAVLTAGLLRGLSHADCVRIAVETTVRAVMITANVGRDSREGLAFEQLLPQLYDSLRP